MIQIDKDAFESLCAILCTEKEMAAHFGCTVAELKRWVRATYGAPYKKVYDRLSEAGRIAIRRSQLELARTSAPMAMWLGKQYLNQRDPDRQQPQQAPEKPAQAAAPSEGAQVLSLVTERRKARKIGEG